ncbi:MAG TPA: DUF2336 domain-containing protein [Kiloniellaceae bacterium]|nr:DUF2336 domain-containing protein [Kiloniellaceae bacterium]
MRARGSILRAAWGVVLALLLLPGTAQAAALTARDLDAAFDELDAYGAYFGAFAARETNDFARERWRRLSLGYPGTADLLRDLLARERLLIADLPPGRVSAVLDRGVIAVDRDLDGRWGGGLLAGGEDAETQRRRDLLLPALIEALGRRQAPQDWPWLADHLRAVGGFGVLAQDPVARPLLARFFHAKDGYLRLAMQRIGESGPAVRRSLAGRQAANFREAQNLAAELAATFGPEPAARLRDDWTDYVAAVDGFAVTRGWVLLDPALRQTQLGAAARRAAGAVRQAAAEVLAEAPRSAVAAARGVVAGPVVPAAGPPDVPTPAATVPLESLVPDNSLAAPPAAGPVVPDFESFAAQMKPTWGAGEAAPAPDEPVATPAAVPAEPSTLAAKQEALAASRPEQPEPVARVPQSAPPVRAPQIAILPQPAPPVAPAPPLPGFDARSALSIAVAALVLGTLLLVLWRRQRAGGGAAAEPVLLLLAAPDAREQPLAVTVDAPAPPAAPAAVADAATLPRLDRQPDGVLRVQGIVPPTAAAAAARRASAAREASRPAPGAPAASESDIAADPIVQALRGGNLPLFELLFGELTGLRAPQLQRIVYGGRGADLAIACRAAGVGKLLFGSIFMLTDHLRGGTPEEEPERLAEFLSFYVRLEPATARKMLAKWQHDWRDGARREPADA